jgi:hypothetical protein
MKNKLIWWIRILLLFSLVNFTSCSKSLLVGNWVLDENNDVIFKFIKDGSGILYTDVGFIEFKWVVTEDSLITIIGSEADGKYNYKIFDSILILTNDNFETKLNKIGKIKENK